MTARVLVVDDLELNVKVLAAKLTAEYFDVVTAMSGAEAGTSRTMTTVATRGKITFSRVVTLRDFFILIARSFSVVRNRMIGGWMIGTSAM